MQTCLPYSSMEELTQLYLDLSGRDIYLVFARIFAQNPGIAQKRVAFELGTAQTARKGNDRYLEDIFSPAPVPEFLIVTDSDFYNQNINSMYEAVLNRHRNYWRSGKVDLFVIRLTNIAKTLEEEQIPFILV